MWTFNILRFFILCVCTLCGQCQYQRDAAASVPNILQNLSIKPSSHIMSAKGDNETMTKVRFADVLFLCESSEFNLGLNTACGVII